MQEPGCTFESLIRELELLFLLLADEGIAGPAAEHFLRSYEEENGHDVFHRILALLDACEADLAARAGSEAGIRDAARYDTMLHRALHWLEEHFHHSVRDEHRKFRKPDTVLIRAWVRLGIQKMRRSS